MTVSPLFRNSSGEKLGHGNGRRSRGWPQQQVDFYFENPYYFIRELNSYRLNLCPPTLSVNPFHRVSTGQIGEDIHSIYRLVLLILK